MTVEPGRVCETCGHRQPYPKRADSPKSVMRSFRVPTEEDNRVLKETENAVVTYLGLDGAKFVPWKVYSLGIALILQDDKMKGWAKR